jgi:hypothetical protein
MSLMWNRGVGSAGLVVAAVIAFPMHSAQAQMGMMMQGQGGDTSITRKGFEAYVTLLALDEDQKDAAKGLLEGNRIANKTLMEEMQAKIRQMSEKARESGDWQIFQTEMPKIGEEFQVKGTKLQDQFFEDLKGLLSEPQLAKFPAVERHRRREMAMRFGLAFGMSTDVVEIVRLAKLDVQGNEEIKGALERYELDLDSLLKSYEKLAKDSQKSALEGGWDMTKIEEALKPLNDAAKQVRDINRATTKRIAGMITSEDQRKAFEIEVKRREFPRIYKESHVERSLAAAMKIPGLEESQKEQLKNLKEQHERDATSKNDAWAKAMEAREEKSGGRIKMLMNMWNPEGEGKNDVADAKKERTELDAATQTRLESILNDEQRAQLPQKQPERGGGGFGMGMFEDFGWDFEPSDEDK